MNRLEQREALPLHSLTPLAWAESVLEDSIALLIDHAYLEKKAATNALDLLGRWPDEWVPGWLETMTSVARDEAAHLAQVSRILIRRGGRLTRTHKNQYANDLRQLVRAGTTRENADRLMVSALIEARSCERFAVLSQAAEAKDPELSAFYKALFSSELGHYKIFLKLAYKIGKKLTSTLAGTKCWDGNVPSLRHRNPDRASIREYRSSDAKKEISKL